MNVFSFHLSLQPAYYNLGVVYSEMMQYDMALTFYEKAASERPMYAEAYCNMGVIYKNRGDLEAAITCYERYTIYLRLALLLTSQVILFLFSV
jgi:tetratricopeptide (TPR) repeat protein